MTTTNEVLALKILKYNKNVVVLPNALNESDLQWRPVPQPSHLYRFGYAGSAAHTTDVPVLRKACNKMHSKITGFQFVLIGYSPQDPATHLFEEVLTSRYTNKKDTYTRFERRPVLDYGGTYNFVDCALAPLDDCLFNRCKSNLKILEAAAHRIPIICSKIHPYYGSDFDKCVLFAESENDWYEKMIKVLHNPNYGKDMGAKAHEIFLKNYTYKQVNKLRSEII